jgi:hypothetical protein
MWMLSCMESRWVTPSVWPHSVADGRGLGDCKERVNITGLGFESELGNGTREATVRRSMT